MLEGKQAGGKVEGDTWCLDERPTTERSLNILTQAERPLDIQSAVTLHTHDNGTPVHNIPGFYGYPCHRMDIMSLVTSCAPSFTWTVTFCPSVTYFQSVSCSLFPTLRHFALMFFMFTFSHSVTSCPIATLCFWCNILSMHAHVCVCARQSPTTMDQCAMCPNLT